MKLVYFNVKGLGETSRILLTLAGAEFEDYRYPLQVVDLASYKFIKTEFDRDKANGKLVKSQGKVPYLEVDGQVISQSKAIERYISRRFNLLGDDEISAARIDSIGEGIRDIKDLYFKEKRNPDGDLEKWFSEVLPDKLNSLENLLDDETLFTSDHAVGGKLSYADVLLYSFLREFFDNKEAAGRAEEETTRIKKIVRSLSENNVLKRYLANRPETVL